MKIIMTILISLAIFVSCAAVALDKTAKKPFSCEIENLKLRKENAILKDTINSLEIGMLKIYLQLQELSK
jgi:hypothetical protein